jgi:hypothetical protein
VAIELPSVVPEARSSVHEVLDVDEELVFRCGQGDIAGATYPLRCIAVGSTTDQFEPRGSLTSARATGGYLIQLTHHHERVIPELVLVLQPEGDCHQCRGSEYLLCWKPPSSVPDVSWEYLESGPYTRLTRQIIHDPFSPLIQHLLVLLSVLGTEYLLLSFPIKVHEVGY